MKSRNNWQKGRTGSTVRPFRFANDAVNLNSPGKLTKFHKAEDIFHCIRYRIVL